MTGAFARLNTLSTRMTALILICVATGIGIMATLSYQQISDVTEQNAEVRIDRAGRASASILAHAFAGTFVVVRDKEGRPTGIKIAGGGVEEALNYRPEYEQIIQEIARVNQGAANMFRFNPTTRGFDRFVTTFRRPDGALPPPMSIGAQHPAYNNMIEGKVHTGPVPVMGRLRLAKITPILTMSGQVVGALAVDVGWFDDLLTAKTELKEKITFWSALILIGVASLGMLLALKEMRPLRRMSKFAHDLAEGQIREQVPHLDRKDEIGNLAQGLSRVVELQGDLEHMAYFDQLTGVANRARYMMDLDKAVTISLAGDESAALLAVDLDHFKETNDAFGHAAGDALLVRVAEMIGAELPEDAKLARIGGDDFMIIVEKGASIDAINELAVRITARLAKPVLLPQGETQLGASIGVVMLPRDAKSGDEAHRNADLALRKAKLDGRGRFEFFSEDLNENVQRQMLLARMLRQAIEENGLAVHFQAQIRPEDNSLYGVEALCRWPHPTRGFIPPSEFIPVAESSGLIGDLGNWVLDESCRIARTWIDAKFDFHHVSVNVSPIQLWQPNFVQQVKDCLERHAMPAHYLCLEVTESVFVNSGEDRVLGVLNQLRDIGVMLSLDDFGSGYSSLGYLNRLPLDQLKVDRSFVSFVDKDAKKLSLLRGIIALGKGLGMNIVAEGAERVEEVNILRELGCNSVQGYFYARPVAPLLVQLEAERIRGEIKIARKKPARRKASIKLAA